MSVRAQDFVFFAGGECLERHGVLVRRIALAEDVAETFTRSSTGLYVGRGGVLKVASANVPRVSYVDLAGGLTWTTPALRMEGSRQNLALHSQALENAAYTNVGSPVVTANAATAPDGTVTMTRIADTDAAETRGRRQTFTVPNDSQSYTFSVYIPVGATPGTLPGYPLLNLRFTGGTTIDKYIVVHPYTGAYFVSSSGAGNATGGVERVGNRWRVWIQVENNSTGNTSMLASCYPAGTDTFAAGPSTAVGGTGTTEFWGFQVEPSAFFPSSYIPTTTVAVTRAAEIFSYRFPWFSLPCSIYVDAVWRVAANAAASGAYRAFSFGGAAGTSYLIGRHEETTASLITQHRGVTGTIVSSSAAAAIGFGVRVKSRHILRANGQNLTGMSVGGGTEVVSSASTAELLTAFEDPTIYLGGAYNGTTQCGFLDLLALKVAFGEHTLADLAAA